TASRSLETLRQEQQAQGFGLRGDISAAADRMQMYIAKGDAALKAKDLTSAEKYYDLAEAEIAKVEKFLGRGEEQWRAAVRLRPGQAGGEKRKRKNSVTSL